MRTNGLRLPPPYVFRAFTYCPLTVHQPTTQADSPPGPPPWAHDPDQYDISEDAAPPPPGIVLRTDYSTGSDDAWAAFCSALRDTEREFFADQAPNNPTPSDGDVEMPSSAGDDGSEDDDASSTDTDDESSLALFAPLSDAAHFGNISNIRALRLLFDVSVRATLRPGQERPAAGGGGGGVQHRLRGLRGLQETYDARGRTLWIFDARSRADGCARLVSEVGDVAT